MATTVKSQTPEVNFPPWPQDTPGDPSPQHSICRHRCRQDGHGRRVYMRTTIWLVVQCAHLEKWWSEFVNGKDDIPYMKWKIKPCLKPPTIYIYIYTYTSYNIKTNSMQLHTQVIYVTACEIIHVISVFAFVTSWWCPYVFLFMVWRQASGTASCRVPSKEGTSAWLSAKSTNIPSDYLT